MAKAARLLQGKEGAREELDEVRGGVGGHKAFVQMALYQCILPNLHGS